MGRLVSRYSRTYGIIAILLLALGLQSCAGSTRRVRREKLSEAMEKASDDYEDEREVSPPVYVEEEDDEDRIVSVEIIQPVHEDRDEDERLSRLREEERDTRREQPSPSYSSGPSYFNAPVFMMTGGTGLMKSNDFYGIHTFSLGLGGYFGEYNRGEIVVGGGWASVQETGTLGKSLDEGVLLLNAGLQYKKFTTPRHTLFGHYFLLGAGYTWMYWGYANPIYDRYGLIRSDSLSGVEFSTGMGFNLLQTDAFQFGGELVPSVILWWFDTAEGFRNDVFDPFLMLKFRVTVSSVPSD